MIAALYLLALLGPPGGCPPDVVCISTGDDTIPYTYIGVDEVVADEIGTLQEDDPGTLTITFGDPDPPRLDCSREGLLRVVQELVSIADPQPRLHTDACPVSRGAALRAQAAEADRQDKLFTEARRMLTECR